jgi:hypothetical protein
MFSLLVAVVLAQAPTSTLFQVTEVNGLKYEITSYEMDGDCYIFHRPDGTTSRWFRNRIRSIQRIDGAAVPAPPPAPEIPEAPRKEETRKIRVPDEPLDLIPGKEYMLFCAIDSDQHDVAAGSRLKDWVTFMTPRLQSESAREEVRINHHVVYLKAGTLVTLFRLDRTMKRRAIKPSGRDEYFEYAIVKVLEGSNKGKFMYVGRECVMEYHWKESIM